MTARILIGICFFSLGALAAITSNAVVHRMIGEVNRKSTGGTTISHYWFWPGKVDRVVSDYRRLRPDGKLDRYLKICVAAMVVGLAGAAVCMMVRFR